MTNMKTPRTRREFERNFHLLNEQMRRNMVHYNENTFRGMESLLHVKSLPNKRIDLLTINEMARLHANTIANAPSMEELAEYNDENNNE